MATKICKQCGELKPEEQFRKYYGGRKGTYNACKSCEKINSREKYLSSKSSRTVDEAHELQKICMLWEYQTTLGLRPPRVHQGKATPLSDSLDSMVDKYAERAMAMKVAIPESPEAPLDLVQWLVNDLVDEPDFYLEEVYEVLEKKYRPQLRIDQDSMMPVYDDTYRDILLKILDRFNAYEDAYYEKG